MRILNHGQVNLVEYMGGDEAVIRNARRCWRSESKGAASDMRLLRHLMQEGHRTPFEAAVFTFDVKAPLFVARQWFRHRIGSYNEESLRYCVATREYYIPYDDAPEVEILKDACEYSFDVYEELVHKGMSKERARSVLPIGTYTRFYWTVNASSLLNFLELRNSHHAQYEIRVYAKAIAQMVAEEMPMTMLAWRDWRESL